ncbi:acetyltransferase [Vallitalea pronyensis]|uniref:Acetyltransferase n=1 Tax=Vallitalea pronyensis TaxID=1348613 RepID=A0A8J8MKQ3_9FIRM|nr:acetyltransferase [Vallitalea pronyensis]QUI23642.1 acetyltransferase [Vallitalea pronyensis]
MFKKVSALLLTVVLTAMVIVTETPIKASSNMTIEATFTESATTKYWDKVERIRLHNSSIRQEIFIGDNEHKASNIVTQFGTAQPHSQLFLLHYAAHWDTGSKPYPVLLVHGAGSNGDYYADPRLDGSRDGLMQYLSHDGYQVFSITFAHPHGDNYVQREILDAAIDRIKEVTGASKVDLIAHSKGNMSARMYVSNVKKSYGTAYDQDVRRYIQLAAPNGGIDYAFRNTWAAWGIMANDAFGPVPFTSMLIYGLWHNTAYHSIYGEGDGGGAYTGQAQMLARWDSEYPLSVTEQDWYTAYHGGWGFFSYSKGIDYAISQGDYVISLLKQSPVDAGVELATLSGNKNTIEGIVLENDGPSDGILFVDSAMLTHDMTVGGATLLDKQTMDYNHIELTYEIPAMHWVRTQLER